MSRKPHLESVYHGGRSGDKTLIATIYFDSGSAKLTQSAIRTLVAVANFTKGASILSSHATLYFVGHADHRRGDDYNKDLGFRRAKSAVAVCRSLLVPMVSFTGITLTAGENAARQGDPSWDEMSADRKVEIRGAGFVPRRPKPSTRTSPTYHHQVVQRSWYKTIVERSDWANTQPSSGKLRDIDIDVKTILELVGAVIGSRNRTDVDRWYDTYGKNDAQEILPIRTGYTINTVDIITHLSFEVNVNSFVTIYSAKIIYTWGEPQHSVLVKNYNVAHSIMAEPPRVRESSSIVLRQIAALNPLLTPPTPRTPS